MPEQQQQQKDSQPPPDVTRWRRGCCTWTPWLVVAGVALLVAAQIAWCVASRFRDCVCLQPVTPASSACSESVAFCSCLHLQHGVKSTHQHLPHMLHTRRAVYTERFVSGAQQLLAALKVTPPAGLSHSLTIVKAVLVGVTSFLGAVLLLLGVVMKKQRLAKRAAPSRAGASTTISLRNLREGGQVLQHVPITEQLQQQQLCKPHDWPLRNWPQG